MTPDNSAEEKLRGDRLFPKRTERNYWVLSEMRRTYEALITKHLHNSDLLIVDYGCGNMPYRPLFVSRNCKYRGYDFKGNDLSYGNLSEDGSLPEDLAGADFLVSSQVLEHVTDVAHYLSEAKRVMKPGGTLFLSTHGTWRYHPDPTDFWRWTSDGLKKTISDAGFVIEDFVGVVGPAGSGLQILQDATRLKIPTPFRKAYFFFFQSLISLTDRFYSASSKAKEAAVFICVAKSPALKAEPTSGK